MLTEGRNDGHAENSIPPPLKLRVAGGIINLIIRITKRHNSCNTDPSAPISLLNMHSLNDGHAENSIPLYNSVLRGV